MSVSYPNYGIPVVDQEMMEEVSSYINLTINDNNGQLIYLEELLTGLKNRIQDKWKWVKCHTEVAFSGENDADVDVRFTLKDELMEFESSLGSVSIH